MSVLKTNTAEGSAATGERLIRRWPVLQTRAVKYLPAVRRYALPPRRLEPKELNAITSGMGKETQIRLSAGWG